ncbi:hypothetical protein GOP47_0000415 [Adiantum capillus-veneris]|uniref:IRS-type PTB domain-containing protein n=1 Tax=Adiantum capillus-veneris TaxID=13818 RepID=A0A9D4VEP3_ADICA|nr:hypothetical protein GOP47_0000415 [Adiantum capillus-veneris]
MADVEYADQKFSLPSTRQSLQQTLLEEDNNQELPYEDPQILFEEDDNQKLLYKDPQEMIKKKYKLLYNSNQARCCDENELNDEERFDDALAETQHDDAWDVSSVGEEDYIDDNLSPPTKDDLHSGSFANLEQPLGSFKQAFGSSNSFVKVPFGASELSFESFAKVQFMEPIAGPDNSTIVAEASSCSSQAVCNNLIRADDVIRKFGPRIYVEGSEREWKYALLRTAAALPPEEDMFICINDYVDFLRSRCTLYGSCWFYVKQKADPRLPHEMFVAINTAGVYFVQVKTKEQLLHMEFTEICSWGYSNISFSLVTGNMTYNHNHRLLTTQVRTSHW